MELKKHEEKKSEIRIYPQCIAYIDTLWFSVLYLSATVRTIFSFTDSPIPKENNLSILHIPLLHLHPQHRYFKVYGKSNLRVSNVWPAGLIR